MGSFDHNFGGSNWELVVMSPSTSLTGLSPFNVLRARFRLLNGETARYIIRGATIFVMNDQGTTIDVIRTEGKATKTCHIMQGPRYVIHPLKPGTKVDEVDDPRIIDEISEFTVHNVTPACS